MKLAAEIMIEKKIHGIKNFIIIIILNHEGTIINTSSILGSIGSPSINNLSIY